MADSDNSRGRRPDDRRGPVNTGPQKAPYDEAAEQAVLGSVFLDGNAMREVGNLLAPEDFYRESHRCIFRAMLDLDFQNEPIDIVTAATRLKELDLFEQAGGGAYLNELSTRVPTAVNVKHYAELVKRKATQRGLIAFARETEHLAHGDVEDIGELVDSVAHKAFGLSMGGVRNNITHISDALNNAVDRTQKLSQQSRRGGLSGVPSGFHALDRKTNGWQRGELIILAARPGMGKTAFALNMLSNAARDVRGPQPGVFFSLEMTKEQLAMRVWASMARVASERLRSGDLRDVDWKKLWPAVQNLHQAPIYIDDTAGLPIAQMMRKCRQLKHEHNIEIVMVDYLQLMQASEATKRASREQQISEISRSLKVLAKEIEVPVIALSQLNRGVESRSDRRPMLSDLRESGAIEQDADVIVFLYRDDYYEQMKGGADAQEDAAAARAFDDLPSLTEVIIAKHRSGPTGKVNVHFHKPYTLFTNMEHDEAPPISDDDRPPDFEIIDDGFDYDAPPPANDGIEFDTPDPFTPAEYDDGDPDLPI